MKSLGAGMSPRRKDRPMSKVPYPYRSTPFPNLLLDWWMPVLRDTEWRVLCVVVRQTLGWKAGPGRKESDRISQAQLCRKTGRASAAVSQAIDRLVTLGLLAATTKTGQPLNSAKRRRNGRGVYYRVNPLSSSPDYRNRHTGDEEPCPKPQIW